VAGVNGGLQLRRTERRQ